MSLRWVVVFVCLFGGLAFAGRRLQVTTSDGRSLSGEVILESDRGLLLRTDDGNVMVPWGEIASTGNERAATPQPVAPGPVAVQQPAPSMQVGPEGKVMLMGFSLGAGGFPLPSLQYEPNFLLATDLSLFVNFQFDRLALRVAIPFQFGPLFMSRLGNTYLQLFGGVEGQIRFQYAGRVGAGIGLQLGLGGTNVTVPGVGGVFVPYFGFGPTLTPLTVQLGAQRTNELSFQASFQFAPNPSGISLAAGLLSLKFSHLF